MQNFHKIKIENFHEIKMQNFYEIKMENFHVIKTEISRDHNKDLHEIIKYLHDIITENLAVISSILSSPNLPMLLFVIPSISLSSSIFVGVFSAI